MYFATPPLSFVVNLYQASEHLLTCQQLDFKTEFSFLFRNETLEIAKIFRDGVSFIRSHYNLI